MLMSLKAQAMGSHGSDLGGNKTYDNDIVWSVACLSSFVL